MKALSFALRASVVLSVVAFVAGCGDRTLAPQGGRTPAFTLGVDEGGVGDTVWVDLNANGLYDAGEPILPGVLLHLTGPGIMSGNTLTDSHGWYLFGPNFGTPAGDYTVCVVSGVPAYYVQTYDLDGLATPNCATATLPTNGWNVNYDFGYLPPGELGNFVWSDLNGDGIQDAGEPGIAGVTVTLTLPDATTRTTTTDANGYYYFGGLAAGNYRVTVATPAGYTIASPTLVGSDRGKDSNVNGALVTLPVNSSDMTIDFGFVPGTGSLGDFVWKDLNRDGVQDGGLETGIPNVTVQLKNATGTTVLATTSTDANGLYTFPNLTLGTTYQVCVVPTTLPAGYTETYDLTAPMTDNCATRQVTTTVPNPTDVDFGYAPPLGSLGDFVWKDLNRNGVQDGGLETGIPNVTVQLKNATGTTVLATTSTDANGLYSFLGLTLGTTYQVCVVPTTLPAGYTETYDLTAPMTDNCATRQVTTTVPNPTDVDFGYAPPAQNACVDGKITNGAVDLGGLLNASNHDLFFFADGSQDANWQGATKGFAGNVYINGITASERTSGGVPFAGKIFTNDATLSAWQAIVNQNSTQASGVTGQTALINTMTNNLADAIWAINGLTVTPGYESVSAQSLNGLNTTGDGGKTYVINVTSGFQVSTQINITGDANDVFILRWDTDHNFSNGYQGQVKFQSGGAIVPRGGLTAANFISVAGDMNASGGGSNPPSPYPQGPGIGGGANFSGGGFFTGYWLTTGAPTTQKTVNGHTFWVGATAPFSNAIFVGGWYTLTTKFSMTSGTSGVNVVCQ